MITCSGLMGFERRVLETIRKFQMIGCPDAVWVAVSGGPDSVALLLALAELQPLLECGLGAIHYHHGTRGPEADADEEFVNSLCGRLSIPLRVGRRARSRSQTGNLEEQLRLARYSFFKEELGPGKGILATGHTLDDQAETVIMKLVRGAGPRGLAGIFPVLREEASSETAMVIRVIRPLLEVTRNDVLDYLQQRQASYRVDGTNLDLDLDRNWVRRDLLPLLEVRLNPQVKRALSRAADWHRNLVELIEVEAERFLAEHAKTSASELSLSVPALLSRPLFWQCEFIRVAALRLDPQNKLETSHVNQIVALTEQQTGRRVEAPGSLQVWREPESLVFTRDRPMRPFELVLNVPGEVHLSSRGIYLRLQLLENPPESPASAHFSCRGTSLKLRNFRAGDRFRTGSASGSRVRKLATLFQEAGIPLRHRSRFLILEEDGELVWVEGFGAAGPAGKAFQEHFVELNVQVGANETLKPERLLR